MLSKRSCGVLLHPTSLPGEGGIGSFGEEAYRFVDLLATMGMTYWQVLPLTPPACGNSPYSAFSAFAGNPLLIDRQQICSENASAAGFSGKEAIHSGTVDFERVAKSKLKWLEREGTAFLANDAAPGKQDFWDFCNQTPWLHRYALFMALKRRYKGRCWDTWPASYALLTPEKYEKASVDLGQEIGVQKYLQWQFFRQWQKLRSYAAGKGIAVIGDIPIFVGYDSADVWGNRELFLLDAKGKPTVVAGVPPDYFSETGQLWGNPLYNWETMEQAGFDWWITRFRFMFEQFDIVRVDHFRGFEAAWHVPVSETTAINGTWVSAPGVKLFDAVEAALGTMPIIAEDLGVITPEVEALRDRYDFPGMKIVQFAFDSGPTNPYLPHNFPRNCVVYAGTHDNDTTAGWYEALSTQQREVVDLYVGGGDDGVGGIEAIVLRSVATTAIIPFQDLLRLGSEARMNIPGTAFGNWGWRFDWEMIPEELGSRVRSLLECFGRL